MNTKDGNPAFFSNTLISAPTLGYYVINYYYNCHLQDVLNKLLNSSGGEIYAPIVQQHSAVAGIYRDLHRMQDFRVSTI
jgi:hypothetical protein